MAPIILDEGPLNLYLTPISHSLLLKSIKYGSFFRIHPYFWNSQLQRIERCSAKSHLAVWLINAFIPIAYFVFVATRAVQTFSTGEAAIRDIILGVFGVAFYLFPATFQLTYLFFGDEFPGLINQGLKLLTEMSRTTPPVGKHPNRKYPLEVRVAEFFACNIFYGFQFLGILVMIFGLTFPGTKFLVSSLHENPRDLQNPYRILSLAYLAYITENYVFAAWTIIIGGEALSFPLCVALEALECRPLTSGTIQQYRCIQLWVAKFNRVYSPLLLPVTEILLIVLSTLGIVGIIRYPGVIGLVVGNVGITTYAILYLLLRFFATINKRSREVTERWRYHARGVYGRQLRTLRPISISIGSYFFIDMCLILTATNLILTNSIALLLVE